MMNQFDEHRVRIAKPALIFGGVLLAAIVFATRDYAGKAAMMGIGLIFYFLPSLVGRAKRNAFAIFLLNLFLGWTLIGWVIALVWAVCHDPDRPNP